MNKTLTVEIDGFKFKGELLATREEFYFTVWTVTEVSTGREFETIDAANEACDMAFEDEKVAREAASFAGIDFEHLCDMAHRFNSRADRESRM
jgi:hypothetical protein